MGISSADLIKFDRAVDYVPIISTIKVLLISAIFESIIMNLFFSEQFIQGHRYLVHLREKTPTRRWAPIVPIVGNIIAYGLDHPRGEEGRGAVPLGDPESLQYHPELQDNFDAVLARVTGYPWDLKYASARLKDDPRIVEPAVRKRGLALQSAGEEARKNPALILLAVRENGLALKSALVQTEEIARTAVRQNGLALEFVLAQTEEIVRAAVNQNALAVKHVKNQTLEIALAAVESNHNAFSGLAPEFKRNKQIALLVLAREGLFLEDVGEELQVDPEVAGVAVVQNPRAIKFAPKLQSDKQTALRLVRKSGMILQVLAEDLRNDLEVVEAAVQNTLQALRFVGERLKENAKFLAFVKANPRAQLILDQLHFKPSVKK